MFHLIEAKELNFKFSYILLFTAAYFSGGVFVFLSRKPGFDARICR
jgi:hypothetical protein